MAATIYLLCAATALTCCLLLFRGYRQTRGWLLLWSGLCFASLTLENIFLFLDQIVFPAAGLHFFRDFFTLLAQGFLLYGLIWMKK
jgi:hypothetical protein